MKFLLSLVFCLVFVIGCKETSSSVSGIVTDVKITQEDNVYQSILVSFEDGRMVSLRAAWSGSLVFQKGKKNVIHYSENGTISKVEVE